MAEGALRLLGVNPRIDNPFFMLVRVYEYPDYFNKDHDLFWRLRSNIKAGTEFLVPGSYRTNSIGLRGGDLATRLSQPQKRIACFGNSCTFGWRLDEDETYAKQLEQALDTASSTGDFEVINCGVPGYSTFQGLPMLKEYQPILKPDFVTICYGWNDHWAAGFDIEDKDQRMPPQFVLDFQNTLSASYAYRSLKYLLLSNYEKQQEYTYNREAPRYRVSLDDYRANLSAMIQFCRDNGIRPILITSPAGDADPGIENLMEQYHEHYNAAVRAVSASLNVPLVDAARIFEDHPEFYDNPKDDFIHYNKQGAAMIATRLADVVSQQVASGPDAAP
jgi:lysophospholipase L1-like esterase